jgi:voltage-gated potassium channel
MTVMPMRTVKARARVGRNDQLTREQLVARERWQQRWNLPILLAALVPLFVTSPDSRAVEVVIGVGSWLVFVVDLVMQRRIVPDYLHRRSGHVDLAIVIFTFPLYLIPGISGYSAILLLARLGRVARVLLATSGLRRFAQRLGKVALVAALVVVACSLSAYGAEHSTNPGFATVGDSLWWGVVTLTTVGYGDIVPKTTAGRLAGVAIMFTGVAVLGVLAGSLASFFGLGSPVSPSEPQTESEVAADVQAVEHRAVDEELAVLRAQLLTVERRLGEVADHVRSLGTPASGS